MEPPFESHRNFFYATIAVRADAIPTTMADAHAAARQQEQERKGRDDGAEVASDRDFQKGDIVAYASWRDRDGIHECVWSSERYGPRHVMGSHGQVRVR